MERCLGGGGVVVGQAGEGAPVILLGPAAHRPGARGLDQARPGENLQVVGNVALVAAQRRGELADVASPRPRASSSRWRIGCPGEADPADVISKVRTLLETHYVFPDIAAAVSGVLAEGLAAGRYPSNAPGLAAAVTADLQSVNGDKHLRLQFHDEALPARTFQRGDDAREVAFLARWADRACGGVARAQRLAGNMGTWTCSRSCSRWLCAGKSSPPR
jgi:N-terminal domain of Peptidase_S41 in eukaryotic IRBP